MQHVISSFIRLYLKYEIDDATLFEFILIGVGRSNQVIVLDVLLHMWKIKNKDNTNLLITEYINKIKYFLSSPTEVSIVQIIPFILYCLFIDLS